MGKFLITGATGDTGRAAVARLLELGHSVRALAHREDARSAKLKEQGAEIVLGDLLDYESLKRAMNGVDGAYFVYPILPGILQATAYFAQAAREAGVKIIVNMSQKSSREDSLSKAAQDHWISEQVFDWSGVPTAHLRPTFFAEWLLYMAPMIRQGFIKAPFGTGRHAPIAAIDQGRVIAGILDKPAGHGGKVYPLYGPREYNFTEIAALVGKVLGKPVTYTQVNMQEYGEALAAIRQNQPQEVTAATSYSKAGKINEFLVQHLGEVAVDHQNGLFAGTNSVVQDVGGQPPMGLEEFVELHRAEFA